MTATFIPDSAEVLAPFAAAGVFGDTEIHFAATLADIHRRIEPGDPIRPSVLLAAALAVRAPLHGSVCIDLTTVTDTVMAAADSSDDPDGAFPEPAPMVDDDGDPQADPDDDLTHVPALDDTVDPRPSLDALDWPDPLEWAEALVASPLVDVIGPDGTPSSSATGPARPLVLDGNRLYLARYHSLERFVARDLRRRALGRGPEPTTPAPAGAGVGTVKDADAPAGALVGADAPAGAVDELFERAAARSGTGVDPSQLEAARAVLERDLVVISGGPGTGKTTTVARLLAGLVTDRHRRGVAGGPVEGRVALAAPTGKAAARMTEAIRHALGVLTEDLPPEVSAELSEVEATTIHRLLGSRPGGGFRHGPTSPLPHEIVIIDEVSMVSLTLMGHLLAAIGPATKVVLVGDPYQLVSVEAGTVLGDVVGAGARSATEPGSGPIPPGALRGSVRPLTTVHRQAEGSAILDLAEAVREGRTDEAVALLERESAGAGVPEGQLPLDTGSALRWVQAEGSGSTANPPDQDGHGAEAATALAEVHRELFAAARAAVAAATDGDIDAALAAIASIKVLCARRRGPDGVEGWNHLVDDHLRRSGRIGRDLWYPGRPTMVTENDYLNDVFNGDVGVAVPVPSAAGDPATASGSTMGSGSTTGSGSADGSTLSSGRVAGSGPAVGDRRFRVWFERAAGNHAVEAVRLDRVVTQWAMSIHKSQGSEFPHAVVVLPPPPSRILTRELLYTAITRAKDRLTVVASEDALRAAIDRPVARASGLADRLR